MELNNGAGIGLKPWEPENLSPLHKNILTLIAAGMRAREISRMEGMPSEDRISVVRNSPAGKAFLENQSSEIVRQISTDTREYIVGHAREATNTVILLMRNAENEGVKLRASQDLLDRAGFKPVERSLEMHVEVAQEDVSRLIEAMAESSQDTPDLHFYEESSKIFQKDEEIVILD